MTDNSGPQTRDRLVSVVDDWKKQAARCFQLAEREKDPIGQKFYQSTAMAYANCATEIEGLLA